MKLVDLRATAPLILLSGAYIREMWDTTRPGTRVEDENAQLAWRTIVGAGDFKDRRN